jgi:hypothetical protein
MKTKRVILLSLVIVILMIGSVFYFAAEKAPQEVYNLANQLTKYGTDPVIVKAVKAQNAKGMTLDEIKKKDNEWKNTAGIMDYMKALMTSPCGKKLQSIMNSKEYFAEIFVMDNKGANVAMSDKTSDYWQGDEAKFQKSYNNGKGAVFVDEVEFDESTQAYLVQVSVPVKDGSKVIGAITFGIDVDKL